MMKLNKFRPLASQTDLDRAIKILTTGSFWCSRFWELNDPMEGVFTTYKPEIIADVFSEKNKYVICSFSGKCLFTGEEAFCNPAMWGYYANGFKGIAIEVEVEVEVEINDGIVLPMDYTKAMPHIDGLPAEDGIPKILLSKLDCWQHEAEYRFLIESKDNQHSVGKITAVYLGEPYGDIHNTDQVYQNSQSLQCYSCLARQLRQSANGIKFYSVKIENGKVIQGKEIDDRYESK